MLTNRLPHGWDCAVDNDGRVYFIDHVNQVTTWTPPFLRSAIPRGPGPVYDNLGGSRSSSGYNSSSLIDDDSPISSPTASCSSSAISLASRGSVRHRQSASANGLDDDAIGRSFSSTTPASAFDIKRQIEASRRRIQLLMNRPNEEHQISTDSPDIADVDSLQLRLALEESLRRSSPIHERLVAMTNGTGDCLATILSSQSSRSRSPSTRAGCMRLCQDFDVMSATVEAALDELNSIQASVDSTGYNQLYENSRQIALARQITVLSPLWLSMRSQLIEMLTSRLTKKQPSISADSDCCPLYVNIADMSDDSGHHSVHEPDIGGPVIFV